MADKKEEVKTKFKGPGQWRSQAARLEKETPQQKIKKLADKAKK